MARVIPPASRPVAQVRFQSARGQSGMLFVLPAVVTMALVIGYPLIYTFRLSVSDFQLGKADPAFNGVANFADVLADAPFRMAVQNTLIWTVLSVFFIVLLGLIAALLVNERLRGRAIVRSTLLIPWIIPGIVAAVLWKWLYHPNFGVLSDALVTNGIVAQGTNLLADPNRSLNAVIAVNVWKSFPFAMLMLLAGLQSVPEELYDAARVDGANGWQRLRAVTLPHLRPVLLVVALLLTIWNMNTFTYVYVLTGGGPIRLTEVVGLYIYQTAFTAFRFGQASAAAVIVFAISGCLTLAYLRVLRSIDA